MSPPGSDNKAVATGNLARALPDGYRQAGQAADAEEAQRLYVEAVSKIGPDHPAAAILASELWIALGQDLKK